MDKIKVVTVDDHKVYLDGLKLNLLEYSKRIELIGEAKCGESLFALLDKLTPDILLLDYHLPDITGIEIISRLRGEEKHKKIKSIILSAHTSEKFGMQCYDFILQALEAGASGYLLKNSTGHQIFSAIKEVYSDDQFVLGESFDFKEVSKHLITDRNRLISFLTRQNTHCLTRRELEVIELLAQGLIVKEIAKEMGISEDSVNSHKENIRTKIHQNHGINLRNSVEMVVWAIKNRLIEV